MVKTPFCSIVMLTVVMMSCSSYHIVRNQSDQAATWSAYKTFAFVDTSGIEPVPSIAYKVAMRELKQSVANEMIKQGYQLATETQGKPDLLINLGAVINEKTQTRQTTIYEAPRYIGQRRYHWQSQEVPVNTYKEGTFSVHIVDNRRDNLVWDAAISDVLSKKGVTAGQVNKAVAELFTKFPGRHT